MSVLQIKRRAAEVNQIKQTFSSSADYTILMPVNPLATLTTNFIYLFNNTLITLQFLTIK